MEGKPEDMREAVRAFLFEHAEEQYRDFSKSLTPGDINMLGVRLPVLRKKAKELAKESDLMIVVGSRKSANTSHLAEILKDCTKTIHITELDKDDLEGVKSIGITAGASTPQKIIDKVIDRIKK